MAWSNHKKIFIALLLLILLSLIIIVGSRKTPLKVNYIVKINNATIITEVVKSAWQQYNGLSNRESLCANCGMLFVFPSAEPREFVMRNMNFPLDIIFIAENKIINIEPNLAPEGAKPNKIYRSTRAADMVLEVSGNYCQKNEIKIGDSLIIKSN